GGSPPKYPRGRNAAQMPTAIEVKSLAEVGCAVSAAPDFTDENHRWRPTEGASAVLASALLRRQSLSSRHGPSGIHSSRSATRRDHMDRARARRSPDNSTAMPARCRSEHRPQSHRTPDRGPNGGRPSGPNALPRSLWSRWQRRPAPQWRREQSQPFSWHYLDVFPRLIPSRPDGLELALRGE